MVSAHTLRQEQRIAMSYEGFLQLEQHAEWVNGEAILFMPPNIRHQDIAGFLHLLLRAFVQHFGLGKVLAAPVEMRVFPEGNAREPDLLFIAHEHLDRLTDQRLAGPADLVVEVVSPESVARDRTEKFYEYQAAGIREYWLIDPRLTFERADFWVLNAMDSYQPIPIHDGIYRSTVLDGFWLNVNWLWAEEMPNPLQILGQIIGKDALVELLN